MQAAARTPSSILKKQLNKENEDATGRLNKRQKLANRRVSFAPEDELETKHIFKRDGDHSTGELNTAEVLGTGQAGMAGLACVPAVALNALPNGQLVSDPLAVLPSPDNLSPLSMDLTNNSFEKPCAATTAAPAPGGCAVAKGSGGAGPTAASLMQYPHQTQQQQFHHQHHHAPYRMDITMNVPNLSTLVEEDEEEYGAGDASTRLDSDADTGTSPHTDVLKVVGNGGNLPSESPMSPNSLREMQMCRDSEHRAEQDSAQRLGRDAEDSPEQDADRRASHGVAPLRERWGFAVGDDDTIEANFRSDIMGDRTYNNVYGALTTGDLTRALHDGRTGGSGHNVMGPTAITRMLAAGHMPRDEPAAGGVGSPARAGPDAGAAALAGTAAAAAAATRGAAGMAVAAGAAAPDGGLASQPQLRHAAMHHQQPPQQQQPELSAMQTQPLQTFNVPQVLAPQPLQARVQLPHSTPFLDNTTRLLEDDQTEAWRLPGHPGAYDRGRSSVAASNRVQPPGYRRGAGAAGGGAGGGETTMLLGPTMTLASAGNGNANTVQLLADTTNQRGAYNRLLQNLHGRLESPAAEPQPRPGAGARPDGLGAAGSVVADQRQASFLSDNMSMDLKVGGGGGGGEDMLDDMSLDAFQMPPEPTMALSQLQQQQQQGEPQARQRPAKGLGAGEVALSAAMGGAPHGRAAGGAAQAAAMSIAARAPPPRLSYQEFLGLIDLSFIDKICRDTYEHGADPTPKTVSEVYEASTLTAAYVEVYHTLSLDLSARLASMGTHMSQVEGELTASKQELFAAVQMLPAAELEMVKEKFASLKELCRLRTVKQIKEAQVAAMEAYLEQLAARKAELQEDMEAVTASVDKLSLCAQDVNAVPAAITRMRQEDEERLQEAAQRKRTLEAHAQRLQALRAQNEERQRRLDSEAAERQAKAQSRVPMEALMEERNALEARAAALRARVATNAAMTPGREGQLIRQAVRKADMVEAILGLHALRLDLNDMETTGTFRFLFHKAFGIECTASDGMMDMKVSCKDAAAAGLDSLAPSIQGDLRAKVAALSCRIPRAHLPTRLEYVMEQLQRMCRLAEQLEKCWLQFNCMGRPITAPAPAPGAAGGSSGGEPALVLRFTNADTGIAVTIRMPLEAALRSDYVKPQLSVQFESLHPAETQQEYCNALQETVLSKLAPSSGYLTAVCYAMSKTLHVSGDAV